MLNHNLLHYVVFGTFLSATLPNVNRFIANLLAITTKSSFRYIHQVKIMALKVVTALPYTTCDTSRARLLIDPPLLFMDFFTASAVTM